MLLVYDNICIIIVRIHARVHDCESQCTPLSLDLAILIDIIRDRFSFVSHTCDRTEKRNNLHKDSSCCFELISYYLWFCSALVVVVVVCITLG